MKAVKILEDDGIQLSNEDLIKKIKDYKYLGIFEAYNFLKNQIEKEIFLTKYIK